ncbi:hypothetical protein ACLBW0_24655 [Enterobacteriaceae bacterium C34A]
MNRFLMIFNFLFLLSSLSYADESETSLYVGVVGSNDKGVQMATTKESLSGDAVLICSTITRTCKSYSANLFYAGGLNQYVEDLATGGDIYTYYLKSGRMDYSSSVDMAIVYPKNKVGEVVVKYNEKGQLTVWDGRINSIFNQCTSSEGVHVYSKASHVHLYYPLGYEVEANCSEEVYK